MKRSSVGAVVVDATREPLVSSAGGVLLRQSMRCSGLENAMSAALAPWRAPRAVHDPAKVVLDLAIAVALGGDCAADLAVVRAQPQLFGAVASDATVSRLVATLAADAEAALAAIRAARAAARTQVWQRQRPLAGLAGGQVIVDLDATLVTAHSDKQGATPTFKYGYGFHPMLAFVDHGIGGSGEALAGLLRPGSAGSNSAADHISVLDAALAQLPEHERAQVVVRTDTGGGVKDFLHHITDLGLQYSVGFYGMIRPGVSGRISHRQRARAEDRIRNLKDTGLTNLPFHRFDQNQIWLELTLLAADLLVWTQVLAFTSESARRWEPKRLRLRLLAVAGRIVTTGRRRYLRLPRGWPWSDLIETGWAALQTT